MSLRIRTTIAAAAFGLFGAVSGPALSEENAVTRYLDKQEADYAAATSDIEATFGMTPAFFDLFAKDKLAGIWNEFKTADLNPDTVLDAKTKHLIALAVAAEAGSPSTIYFHTSAALANGASAKEIQEAVAVAVVGGTWADVLTVDHFYVVKADTDALFDLGSLRVQSATPTN